MWLCHSGILLGDVFFLEDASQGPAGDFEVGQLLTSWCFAWRVSFLCQSDLSLSCGHYNKFQPLLPKDFMVGDLPDTFNASSTEPVKHTQPLGVFHRKAKPQGPQLWRL